MNNSTGHNFFDFIITNLAKTSTLTGYFYVDIIFLYDEIEVEYCDVMS